MDKTFYQQFETPCLVIDEQIVKKNISDMQNAVDKAKCTLRPHVKTHKMPYFAKMQIDAGACGITSCKVSEAEVMADGGITDIFIAYPLVGVKKLRRACDLSKRIGRLILAVDSLEQAVPLAEAADANGLRLEVRIEVECGGTRTGVELERFAPLVSFVESNDSLNLTGLYTFRGVNGITIEPADAAAAEVNLMEEYRKVCVNICHREVELSGGSTPTGREVAKLGKMTEIRPGTYIFNDYMLHEECGVPLDRMAAKLLVTVVSVHNDYVVVDGGCKTFALDPTLDQPPYYFNSYAYFPENRHLRIRRLNEEHGIIESDDGRLDMKVGDILEAIPLHVCTAMNLQNYVYVCNGNDVHAERVAARGMLQ